MYAQYLQSMSQRSVVKVTKGEGDGFWKHHPLENDGWCHCARLLHEILCKKLKG